MPKRKQPSASGTEYVNAQLLDLKELIDHYADEIRKHALPVRIRIKKKPNKLIYTDGQTIKKKGMVVKAYYKSGKLWGVVPLEDVTLNPTKADIDQATKDAYSSDLSVKDKVPMPYSARAIVPSFQYLDRGSWMTSNYIQSVRYLAFAVVYNESDGLYGGDVAARFVVVSPNDINEVVGVNLFGSMYSDSTYRYNGKTVHYWESRMGMVVHGSYGFRNPTSNVVEISRNRSSYIGSNELGQIAWTIRYGELIPGGIQKITVSWPRPVDGQELTAKFKIKVT